MNGLLIFFIVLALGVPAMMNLFIPIFYGLWTGRDMEVSQTYIRISMISSLVGMVGLILTGINSCNC